MTENTNTQLWWACGKSGLVGYLGRSPKDGLEYRRHWPYSRTGVWQVAVTGWGMFSLAVIDDFGDLVKVPV